NRDRQLTLMASSLYRLFAHRIGNGYQHAKSRHPFRDFINATAHITLTERDVVVRFQKRAHNPLLLAADYAKTIVPVPWLATNGCNSSSDDAVVLSQKTNVGIQARHSLMGC
ncbi:MAG: hypothetical protein L0H73_07270, partial [Nitrococcus sp.]|nr:hypothetical protein [Nitrococcus sp.]